LEDQAGTWSTPKTITGGANSQRETRPNTGGTDLQEQVKIWPTPRAEHDSGRHHGAEDTLHSAVKGWCTPNTIDAKGGNRTGEGQIQLCHQAKDWSQSLKGDLYKCVQCFQWFDLMEHQSMCPICGGELENLMIRPTMGPNTGMEWNFAECQWSVADAKDWPTPQARDWKSGCSNVTDNARPLNEEACRFTRPDPTTLTAGSECLPSGLISPPPSRKLNPRFVEWLMGIPTGWTDCGFVETESIPIPQNSPLEPSTGDCAE
jgi:hypothetical protein